MAYGKRNYKKKAKNTKLVSLIRKVAKNVQPMRMYDYGLPGTFGSILSTGTQLELTGLIAEGDGYYHRSGSKVRILGVRISGVMSPGDTVNVVRILMEQNDPSKTLTHTIDSIVTKLKGNTQKKYHDEYVTLSTTGDTAVRTYNRYIKINKTVNYASTLGQALEGIYLYMIGDSTAIPNPGFTVGSLEVFFKNA